MRHMQRIRRKRPGCRVDSVRPVRDTGPVPSRDITRLAAAARTARERAGLTQEEFAERGGLTSRTIIRLEAAVAEPRAKTLHGLDRAAGWPLGTARAVLDGTAVAPDSSAESHEGSVARQRIAALTDVELAERIVEIAEVQGVEAAGAYLAKVREIRQDAERAAGPRS